LREEIKDKEETEIKIGVRIVIVVEDSNQDPV
jgi:hypothetical protein